MAVRIFAALGSARQAVGVAICCWCDQSAALRLSIGNSGASPYQACVDRLPQTFWRNLTIYLGRFKSPDLGRFRFSFGCLPYRKAGCGLRGTLVTE